MRPATSPSGLALGYSSKRFCAPATAATAFNSSRGTIRAPIQAAARRLILLGCCLARTSEPRSGYRLGLGPAGYLKPRRCRVSHSGTRDRRSERVGLARCLQEESGYADVVCPTGRAWRSAEGETASSTWCRGAWRTFWPSSTGPKPPVGPKNCSTPQALGER